MHIPPWPARPRTNSWLRSIDFACLLPCAGSLCTRPWGVEIPAATRLSLRATPIPPTLPQKKESARVVLRSFVIVLPDPAFALKIEDHPHGQ